MPQNPPAFPYYLVEPNGSWVQPGMTLRQWYAGQALISALKGEGKKYSRIARDCFKIADAMLFEGENTP